MVAGSATALLLVGWIGLSDGRTGLGAVDAEDAEGGAATPSPKRPALSGSKATGHAAA